MANPRQQVIEDLRRLVASGDVRSSQQPLRGRPAEGLKPLGSVILTAARQQREDGGPSIAGTGLPNLGSSSFPSRVFRNQLLDAGIDVSRPGVPNNALLGGFGGNFRGGSSTGTAAPAGNIGVPRGTFGLSGTDRAALGLVGALPGFGLPTLGVRAINRLFGPQIGVIGAQSIAPRPGTAAFRGTVSPLSVGRFGINRGPIGFGGFAPGGFGGGFGGGAGRGGGTQGGAGQGPNR